jgi:hypothetical protein
MSRNIHLITVAGSHVDILPYMLEHYRALGIESFFVNVHLSSPTDPVYEQIREITTRFGCGIASVQVGDWQSLQVGMYALQRERYPDDWFVLADQDELQFYPAGLREIVNDCASQGWDYIRGCFVDRIAADGSFPALRSDAPLREQYPLGGFVSNPVLGADPRKVVAVRGNLPIVKGQHHVLPNHETRGRACPSRAYYIPVHHFKWTGGIHERLASRLALFQKQGVPHWDESARFLEYYTRSGGRLNLRDPHLHLAPAEPEYLHWDAVKKLVLTIPVPD